MPSHSLQGASTYLNNLLLARGLLQDGKSIDFAHPDHGSGDTDETMSRIINLVHDLVLRRDRDADQCQALASNIRTLRAEETQRVLNLQRVQDKNADLTRDVSTMEAQARALQSSVRKAEAQARDLKEQMLKMKSTLDQVRAKCISDTRKRDTEIEKLKGHITGLQRGKREASGMKINVINPQQSMAGGRERRTGQDVNSAEWSLEQETNDFLAALVNETSTENVTLRNIIEGTIETLTELTGLEQLAHAEEEDDGIGIPGQYRKSRQKAAESAHEAALVSCESLGATMGGVLEHCRSILKDPSFVPIEELQIRDEEIIKLREGWEKMASRWKDAVTMMDTWRKRMLVDGQSGAFDELSNLGFGRSIATLPNGQPVLGQDDELSSVLFDTSRMEDVQGDENAEEAAEDEELEIPPADLSEESELEIPAEPSPKRLAASPARRGLKLPRPKAALNEINNNIGILASKPRRQLSLARSGDSGIGSLDESAEHDSENDTFRNIPRSRIPRQTKKENIPPMTVSEKLAAIEAEAQEAQKEDEKERESENPQKRKRTKREGWRKATRRRSTLAPEELAALMGVR